MTFKHINRNSLNCCPVIKTINTSLAYVISIFFVLPAQYFIFLYTNTLDYFQYRNARVLFKTAYVLEFKKSFLLINVISMIN